VGTASPEDSFRKLYVLLFNLCSTFVPIVSTLAPVLVSPGISSGPVADRLSQASRVPQPPPCKASPHWLGFRPLVQLLGSLLSPSAKQKLSSGKQ